MMRDIILPGNEGHNDFAKSLETREESVAVSMQGHVFAIGFQGIGAS